MAHLAIQPDEPTAAVPLGYFDQRAEPWLPIVRFGGWLSIAYSAVVILSEATVIAVYAWQQIGWTAGIKFDAAVLIIFTAMPALMISLVQLIGGILSVRLRPAGRLIVLWTSAALLICWVLAFCLTTGVAVVNHSFANSGVTYFVHTMAGNFSQMFYRMSVPATLVLLFRRREVRDVFGTR